MCTNYEHELVDLLDGLQQQLVKVTLMIHRDQDTRALELAEKSMTHAMIYLDDELQRERTKNAQECG